VLKEEKVLGQKFVVDVTMSVCMRAAAASDDLVDTMNYAAAFDLVKSEVQGQSRQGGLLRTITRPALHLLLLLPTSVCAFILEVSHAPISLRVLVLNDPHSPNK